MTGDSHLYQTKPAKNRLPLYEGKMIHQFRQDWSEPRYWLDEKEAAAVLLASRRRGVEQFAKRHELEWNEDEKLLLDYKSYRLAFRDVAASTNERTMIMTVLPPNRFCPHTMSLESVYTISVEDNEINPNHQLTTNAARLFLCAVMNSFVVDAWLRRSVTNHLSFFFVYGVPVPRLTEEHPQFAFIIERAARLICTTPEYDELARSVGLKDHTAGAIDEDERAQLRAELDAAIAHVYGLTETEFAYVLSTFPLVAQPIKDRALAEFKREDLRIKKESESDTEIGRLLRAGESATLEFKSSARWDIRQDKQNKAMEDVIVKTVAAFLNSETGGTLLIGVDDDASIVGLSHDYITFGKKSPRDAYENFLTTLLLNHYGKDTAALLRITFHAMNGEDVARIAAKPAPRPIFIKDASGEHLYTRTGNSTRQLTTREAIEYCKIRWK